MMTQKLAPTESQLAHGVVSMKQEAPLKQPETKAAELKEIPFQDQLENLGKRRHYEAEMRPKKDDHAHFMRKCAGYVGTDELGKVSANLDPRIWSWLQSIDPELISQCYVDAVLLSGEYSSASSDASTLLIESGASESFTPEKLAQVAADQKSSQMCLSLMHAKREHSHSPFKNHFSRKLRQQYFMATSGGELKKDYPIYCRSLNFRKQILEAAKLPAPAYSQNAVEKTKSRYRNQAQFVIALKRLQNLHEAAL